MGTASKVGAASPVGTVSKAGTASRTGTVSKTGAASTDNAASTAHTGDMASTTLQLDTITHLTGAQYTLLARIGAHASPVTVTELAHELGRHVSSVRETLDALLRIGLVTSQRLPASGRGRPALGYSAHVPAGPVGAPQLFDQVCAAFLDYLRANVPDPLRAARRVGCDWGGRALTLMKVPDHHDFSLPESQFPRADHLEKIRMFLNIFGFGVHVHPQQATTLVLTAIPFGQPVGRPAGGDGDEPGTPEPDPLALELRRGMVERALELTACDDVVARYLPGPGMEAELVLTRTTGQHDSQSPEQSEKPMTHIRYFAAAAEAAGTDSEQIGLDEIGAQEISVDKYPTTLGELVDHLAGRHAGLAKVLRVSSFLVNERPADRDAPLPAGAVVDVLPPFAGG